MRRDVSGALRLLAVPTFTLVLVAAGAPGRLELAARVYALVACGVGLGVALRAIQRAFPPETPLGDPAKRLDATRRQPPPSLARLEQVAALGVASSFDLHYRFLPLLRSIAAGLLRSHRRVDLSTEHETSREILGEETWELVRVTRPPPQDRTGRGLTPAELGRIADSVEGV